MELTLEMVEASGEPIPGSVRRLSSARLAKADAEFVAKYVIIDLVPGDADHGERFRQ
jgi:hypothetical protein